MKKVYFGFLLLVVPILAFGQTTTSNIGAGEEANWLGTKVQGTTTSSWDNGEPTAGYTVVVSANEIIFINKEITIAGAPVKVIVYGILDFRTAGKLILPTGSVVEVKEGGDVSANTGNNSQLLQIGDAQIEADEIDLIKEGDIINEAFILPVDLLYFEATAQTAAVELQWAASKAWDFSHYELERSPNGQSFEYVATLDAEENADYLTEFSYSDRQPLNGTSYYRLKAVDVDGKYEYKGMVTVQFINKNFEVYPNPATQGVLKIGNLPATENAQLILRDHVGRTIRNMQLEGKQNQEISTSGLPEGLYILLIKANGHSAQRQVYIR